jgi:hypothetical protein
LADRTKIFSVSAGNWRLYATERPNSFVGHHKGYVVHLINIIDSVIDHSLISVERRIVDIEAIRLPPNHFIRPRAVYYDDKNGSYTWHIDYLHPRDETPCLTEQRLLRLLRDGWALDDGQIYFWDVRFVSYYPFSDHFDFDHYQYYLDFRLQYNHGVSRRTSIEHLHRGSHQISRRRTEEAERIRDAAFDQMVSSFRKSPFLGVMNSINCQVEAMRLLENQRDWSEAVQNWDIRIEHMFPAKLVLEIFDQGASHNFLLNIPNDIDKHFRVGKIDVYAPDVGRINDKCIYDLEFSLHPVLITDVLNVRREFNSYFEEIKKVCDARVKNP